MSKTKSYIVIDEKEEWGEVFGDREKVIEFLEKSSGYEEKYIFEHVRVFKIETELEIETEIKVKLMGY